MPTAFRYDRHTTRLKHQQLRSQLLGQIAAGAFRPGDVLPSEHQLAELMSVSRTTVRQTLGDMEREGLVRRVQGKGTFVSERTTEQPIVSTASLALIIPEVASGYYPTLVSGFERAAHEVGRPIVVCNTYNDVDKQANHIMRLIDQRSAGVLLRPSTANVTPAYQVRQLQEAEIPVVLLHRGVPDVEAPVIELPCEEIGRRAGRLIVEAGHRRVAYVASHRYAASELYECGFRAVLREAGLDLPDRMVIYGEMTRSDAEDFQAYELFLEQQLDRLMNEPDRPTALFMSFDATAEIMYLIAGRKGIRVPEDLSFVSFGGAERKGALTRKLTAITVDEEQAAFQAVEMLVQMTTGRRPIRGQEIMPMSLGLSKGQSLRAAAQA